MHIIHNKYLHHAYSSKLATEKYTASPIRSFAVVINGPDATAGLMPIRLSNSGVIVPKTDDMTTTLKRDMETTKLKVGD
jgi:hypothetical protein